MPHRIPPQRRLLRGEIQIMNIKVYPNRGMNPIPNPLIILEILPVDPMGVVQVVEAVEQRVDLGNS